MAKSRDIADSASVINYIDGLTSDVQTQLDDKATLASPTFTGTVTAGGLSLGDNEKATFGASNDLQIYHDGSNSYIAENGTGNLILKGTNLTVESSTGENYFVAFANADTRLYYDNAQKLATTATGIDVTGTATMDGLTVGGNILRDVDTSSIVISGGTAASTGANAIFYGSTSGNVNDILLRRNNVKFATFDGATGDISFYEDTGTTPKFFWDASAESLGIGTESPQDALHVYNASSLNHIKIDGPVVNRSLNFSTSGSTRWNIYANSTAEGGANSGSNLTIAKYTDAGVYNGAALFIERSSGNVGIGTTSPNTALQVSSAVTTKSVVETTGAASDALLEFTRGQGSGNTWSVGLDQSNASALSFAYLSNGSPSLTTHGKVTIDTAGTVNANAFAGDGSALTNLPSSGGTVLFDKKLFGGI